MPKVKSKSLGRKFKGLTPSRTKISAIGSQEETSQLADASVNDPTKAEIEMHYLARHLSEEEDGEITAIRSFEPENTVTSGAENQPGPSGVQQNTITNPTATPEEEIRQYAPRDVCNEGCWSCQMAQQLVVPWSEAVE